MIKYRPYRFLSENEKKMTIERAYRRRSSELSKTERERLIGLGIIKPKE